MKLLQNKSTGEIGCLVCLFDKAPERITVVEYIDGRRGSKVWYYDTLAKLNSEWEDYEEPKKYWSITGEGDICRDDIKYSEWIKEKKSIGNYFESKEEAERAVEKLKAYKRLKDKGFIWQGWEEGSLGNGMCVIGCQIPEDNWETDIVEDLDLLFGEEEE